MKPPALDNRTISSYYHDNLQELSPGLVQPGMVFYSSGLSSSGRTADGLPRNGDMMMVRNIKYFLGSFIVFFWFSFGAVLSPAQWIQTKGPYGGGNIFSVCVNGSSVLAGAINGLYRSSDNGATWHLLNRSMTYISGFAVLDSEIFATDGQASTDDGLTWHPVYLAGDVRSLAVMDTIIFAGGGNGVQRSTDRGASWYPAGLDSEFVWSLTAAGPDLYAGTDSGGVFLSTNAGLTWLQKDSGLADKKVLSLAVNHSAVFAGTAGGGVFRTTNNGSDWQEVNDGLVTIQKNVYSLAADDSIALAGTQYGFFISTDNGGTWNGVSGAAGHGFVYSVVIRGPEVFAGGATGIDYSPDHGRTWTAVGVNADVPVMAACKSRVFAGTGENGLFWSDDGENWQPADNGSPYNTVHALTVRDSTIFAAAGSYAYRSTDVGMSWQRADSGLGLGFNFVQTFSVGDPYLFAGTYFYGVFRSSDDGSTWQPTPMTNPITAMIAQGKNVFVSSYDTLYRSTDDGSSWQALLQGAPTSVQILGVCGSSVFASNYYGFYQSTDTGVSWVPVDSLPAGGGVTGIFTSNANVFVTTLMQGVFLSTDSGTSWKNIGLTSEFTASLTMTDSEIFVGTGDNGVWRRSLAEVITSVRLTENARMPARCALYQNYPNPFNPTTTIRYDLPGKSRVSLKIYDVLGRVVATLKEGVQGAGSVQVEWNGSGFASGIYFCRLDAVALDDPRSPFVDVKRLVLMK